MGLNPQELDQKAASQFVSLYLNFVQLYEQDLNKISSLRNEIFAAIDVAYEYHYHQQFIALNKHLYRFFTLRGLYETAKKYYTLIDPVNSQHQFALADQDILLILDNLGWICYRLGEFDNSKYYFEQALKFSETNHMPNGIVKSLLGLGVVANVQAQYIEAEALLSRGISIARENFEDALLPNLLMTLGLVEINKGNYEHASSILDEGLPIAEQTRDDRLIGLLHNISISYLNQGDYTQAENYIDKALGLAQGFGSRESICGATLLKGVIASCRGEFNGANEAFQEGLSVAREIGNPERIIHALQNIGSTLSNKGDYDESEPYLLEGYELAADLGLLEWSSILLSNLAEIAILREELDEAEKLSLEGLAISQHIGSIENMCANLQALGTVYFQKKIYDKSIYVFKHILKLAEKSNFQEFIGASYFGLAKIAKAQGSNIEACANAEEAIKIFQQMEYYRFEEVKNWYTANCA